MKNVINFQKLKELIDIGSKKLADLKLSEAILVIGDTGNGKSTLVNALIGNDLTAYIKSDDLDDEFALRVNSDGPKVSDKTVACTSAPEVWRDKLGTAYIDCPGFEDTRSVEQDIVNAFLVKKIFNSIPKVKIILVSSIKQINSDRQKDFLNLLDSVVKMFPDANQIKDSLCLVITKVSNNISTQKIREKLDKVKKDHQSSLDSTKFNNKKFCDFWDALKDGNISIFHSPKEEGKFLPSNEILRIKDQTKYIKIDKVNISVSYQSKSSVLQNYGVLIKNFDQDIESLCVELKKFAQDNDINWLSEFKEIGKIVNSIINLKLNTEYTSIVKLIDDLFEYINSNKSFSPADLEMLDFIKISILEDLNFGAVKKIKDKIIPVKDVYISRIKQIEEKIEEQRKEQEFLDMERKNNEIQKQNDIKISKTRYEHAEMCYKNQNYSDGLDSINKVISIDEKYSIRDYKHYELLGKIQIQLNYYKGSVDSSFKKMADMVANPYVTMFIKATEYIKIKKYDLAISAYKEAGDLTKENDEKASCFSGIANVYYNNKSEYKTAAEWYQKAYQNTSDNSNEATYKSNEGCSWRALGNGASNHDDKIKYYKESISCYETAYNRKADQEYKESIATIMNMIGNVYYNNKSEYKTAAEWYQKAYQNTSDNSNEATYKSNEGCSWRALGNGANNHDDKIKYYKESISCYETAYNRKADQEYKNGQAWSHNSMGCVYYNKEWWNSAYDEFKKAYNLSNKLEDYREFKKNANDCFGIFSGAGNGRQKINFAFMEYDNPILNLPKEKIEILVNNSKINFSEILNIASNFDKEKTFLLEEFINKNPQDIDDFIAGMIGGDL